MFCLRASSLSKRVLPLMVLLSAILKNAAFFVSDTANANKEESHSRRALGETAGNRVVKIAKGMAPMYIPDEKQNALDIKVETKLESPVDIKFYEASDERPKRFFVKTKGGKKNKVIFDTKKTRGKVHHVFDNLEVVVVSFDNSTDVSSFEALGYNSNLVEPDPPRYLSRIRGISSKNHRSLQGQVVPWGLNTVFENVLYSPDPAKVQKHICIVDDGFDDTHPDLQGIEVTSGNGKSTVNLYSECSHGTHIAGTIVANNNEIGSLGILPGAPITVINIFNIDLGDIEKDGEKCGQDPTYASDLVMAANECYKSGARIINLSLGGPSHSSTEESQFALLRQLGVLVFAAASNNALKGNPLSYPASYSSVISVANIDYKFDRAPDSNYNYEVDIAAPGSRIFSTIGNGGYALYSGTSMACPFAAGLAFSLWNDFPYYSSETIRTAILSTAKDIGNKGKDVEFGYGLIRYWPARSYLTSLTSIAPESQIFKLCQNYPCDDDQEQKNFYEIGNWDWDVMPPQIGDNELSYVYIPAGWTFQYFEKPGFGGLTRVYGNYKYSVELPLAAHDNMVSSFKLRQFPSSEMVKLCQNNPCGTGGFYYAHAGNWKSMPPEIGNCKLSWIYLPAGYSITLYAEENFEVEIGTAYATEDARRISINEQWDDSASSFIIALV